MQTTSLYRRGGEPARSTFQPASDTGKISLNAKNHEGPKDRRAQAFQPAHFPLGSSIKWHFSYGYVSPMLFGRLRQVFVLLVVVVDDAAVGQSEVGQEVMRTDHAPHREIGDRRIDMWHEMKPAGTDP